MKSWDPVSVLCKGSDPPGSLPLSRTRSLYAEKRLSTEVSPTAPGASVCCQFLAAGYVPNTMNIIGPESATIRLYLGLGFTGDVGLKDELGSNSAFRQRFRESLSR